jgi:hypothetical protein
MLNLDQIRLETNCPLNAPVEFFLASSSSLTFREADERKRLKTGGLVRQSLLFSGFLEG